MKNKSITITDIYGIRCACSVPNSIEVKGATIECSTILFKDMDEDDRVLFNGRIWFKLNQYLLDYHGEYYEFKDDAELLLIGDCVIF